jgi:fibronectin type III domain protein
MRGSIPFILLMCFCYASAHAQQGCCSRHGGVCNCACCDGTPLSDICRPFFPCGGGAPSAPSGLSTSSVSSTQCILRWIDNASNESSFQIESKNEAQGFYLLAGTVGANVTQTTIIDLVPENTYSFRVRAHGASGDSAYSNVTTITTLPDPSTACQAPAACFSGNRFRVEAQWKIPSGAMGNATAVRITEDSGYLWFFSPSNVEVVFKILNACSLNQAFWFYAGGLTNVQVTIVVTDTLTGRKKTYTNPLGQAFQPIQDTSAFTTCP